MTTDPHDEHGEILRRALHAEADTVTPAGDGLERIRARIAAGERRRFGWDWFTANWARPVLAVAAAVAVAGLGVTAPQTIDLIQQSVGSNNPSGGDRPGATKGEQSAPDGTETTPGRSGPQGTTTPGSTSSSEVPAPASPPGSLGCATPDGSPSAAGSRGTGAQASASPGGSCSTPTPPVTPPTPPSSPPPATTPPPSQTPPSSEEPTPPPSSSPPAATTEQGASSTP